MRRALLALLSLLIFAGIDEPRMPVIPEVEDDSEEKVIYRPCIVEREGFSAVKTRCEVLKAPMREGYCESNRLASLSLEKVASVSYRAWKWEPLRGATYRFLPARVEVTLADGNVLCLRGGPRKWKTEKGTYYAYFYSDVNERKRTGKLRETPLRGTVTRVTFSSEKRELNLDFWPFTRGSGKEK